MDANPILPNTFLIGAQKSATTSVYNWIAQHPDVCGPASIKDYPFFGKDAFYSKGIEKFTPIYQKEGFNNEKIILQGNVNYMFIEKAIQRIKKHNRHSKLIVVLRDPAERAVSAYRYFRKIQLETLPLREAIEKDEDRLRGDFQTRCELTYFSHGKYASQLKTVFKYFPRDQVLILFYQDVQDNPMKVVKEAYQFLGVAVNFTPDFKVLNITGAIRFKFLQKAFFGKSRIRKYLVNNIIDPFLPLHRRTRLRHWLREWNTKEKSGSAENFDTELRMLRERYLPEVSELEKLLNIKLPTWKP